MNPPTSCTPLRKRRSICARSLADTPLASIALGQRLQGGHTMMQGEELGVILLRAR
jgi:hypothetical protein